MERLRVGIYEFDLEPMGISEDTMYKTRSFKVRKINDLEDMRNIITEGMARIDHIGNDNMIVASYTDCVALKAITVDYGEEQDTYNILLSTDANMAGLKALQSSINATQANIDSAICELTILIATGGMMI